MLRSDRLVPRRELPCLAALLLLTSSCMPPAGTRRAAAPAGVASPVPRTGEFIVAANVLDTWNTIGQVLVRLQGVTYEGRAQMLGLYTVRYRGEPLLIHAGAMVIEHPGDGLRTRVKALTPGGAPLHSAAAVELLDVLASQVPAQIDRYHMPINLKPPTHDGPKKPKKSKPRRRH
jgi:hypothetical protein